MNKKLNRRDFARYMVAGGAGLLTTATMPKITLGQDNSHVIHLPLIANGALPPVEPGLSQPIMPVFDDISIFMLQKLKLEAIGGVNSVAPNWLGQEIANWNPAIAEAIKQKTNLSALTSWAPMEDFTFDPNALAAADIQKLEQSGVITERLREVWGKDIATEAPVQAANTTYLGFYIRRIQCEKETGEWGDDEIAIAGVSVDESGDTKKIDEQRIEGDFSDGDSRFYPNWRYHSFNITEPVDSILQWPKKYTMTLIMAEKDGSGFQDFVNNLWIRVRDQVQSLITAGINLALTSILGPVFAGAIGAAVGWVIGKFIGWLLSFGKDDMFKPVATKEDIRGYDHYWMNWGQKSTVSPVKRLMFEELKGGGIYSINYNWQLS
ncbi:MAG: hypothetical protein KDJ52_34965 [Anaerolineae bacterium]|nr:hypothetical protein [Anaerolineae bacterium]